ncbi:MAG: hypothetical protein ACHP84_19120 [Caulobacterales bacterium]|jgi:hypothetical protein
MYTSHIAQLLWLLIVVTTIVALWKGDLAERMAGAINLTNAVAISVIHLVVANDTRDVFLLVADGAWAVGFLFLALRYASFWLGGAMLLQAVQFSLHAYYMVVEAPHDRTYAWVNNLDTFGICICIAAGTIVTWRKRFIDSRDEPNGAAHA